MEFKPPWARCKPAAPAEPRPDAPADESGPALTAFDVHRRAFLALDELLGGSDTDRATWFTETGVLDPVLATQVAMLLRADAVASQSLPTDPPKSDPDAEQAAEPQPPERIGPYRLVERLGRGGMGDVFLGVRDDGLFDQRVAIKVIRAGLFSPQLTRRFAEERRILASLQHPHIAQMFDGGSDAATGLSYIVMEYLEGQTITDYVQKERPSLDTILKLFADVCAAVQFAHQNLVVHADIKPSNIIVTPKSGVKLLDFGIARLIDPHLGSAAALGQPEPMTRAYAAPERRQGAPPSVSSDVYGLGALLFELVVGALPAALTHTEFITVEGATSRPPAWILPSRALAQHHTDSPIKPAELEGDLDSIIAKALTPDPADRYATVVELATDLERRRLGLAVHARPDTWQYRSAKFIGRHRLGLTITAAAMILAALATGITTKLYLDAEQARTLADQRFDETRSMANYMIFDADPQMARLAGALPVRRDMVSKTQAYLKTLEADPRAPTDLRIEIASGYVRLARIYGLDVSGGTGDMPAARAALKRGLAILDEVAKTDPGDPKLLYARGQAQLIQANEAFLLPDAVNMPKALDFLNQAIASFDAFLKVHPGDVDANLGRWRAQVTSGRLLQYLDRTPEAIARLSKTLTDPRPKPQTISQTLESNYIQTGAYLILAENYGDIGNIDEALRYYTLLNQTLDQIHKSGLTSLDNDFLQTSAQAGIGRMLATNKRYDEAISSYQQSIAGQRRILSFGDNDAIATSLVFTSVGLADIESLAGHHADAAALMDEAIATTAKKAALNPNSGGVQRFLAIYIADKAIFQHRAKNPQACDTDKKAWNQWVVVTAKSGVMPMDAGADGPMGSVARRLGVCGVAVNMKKPMPVN